MSKLPRILVAVAAGLSPLGAQRPPRPIPARPPATVPATDTAGAKKPSADYTLNFQDQDIRVVLSAIAEAGGLNLTLANLPQRNVTLRMGQPASRDEMVTIIKGIAESNGLKVSEAGALIRVEGDIPPTAAQAARQQQVAFQAPMLRLYTYRLKHASAVQLAPVLMSLLSGATGTTGFNNNAVFTPNGGFQVIPQVGPAGAAGAGAAGGGGAAGGAGRGGAAGGGGAGGAAGGAGGGGVGGGGGGGGLAAAFGLGGRGGAAGAAIQQFLGQAQSLSTAANAIRIVAEETSNSLLIRSTADDWALIQQLVGGIDLRPLQVLIEVTIAEVQRTHDLNVGLSGTATRKGATPSSPTDTVGLLPGNTGAQDFIFQLMAGHGSINYLAALNALQTRGDVRILSLPVIIAQNNRQAELDVGEQRPFVQVSQSVVTSATPTTVQTVQYISVGTDLTITPTINPDGYVNLQIKQTNNSATSEIQFNAPVISQREATTQIFLRDGQTTVIGGLAGNTTSHTVSGIPLLSRIPWIGGVLFGNTTHSTATTELFLFLTPHIISTDEDIDRLRNSLQRGSDLLKDVPVGPRVNPLPGDTIRVKPDSGRGRPGGAAR